MFHPIQPGCPSRFAGGLDTHGPGPHGAARRIADRRTPPDDGPPPLAAAVTAAVERERGRVARDLHDDVALAQEGLAAAVERLAREFLARTGTRCDLYLAGDLDAPEPYASTLFGLVQEALANARKHAAAKEVTVSISRQGGLLSFCVRDDGKGFSPRAARRADAMGLAGMEERAHLVGGELLVSSTPGGGTVVAGCIRVDRKPDADVAQRGGRHALL